ncbi:MAG: hypothetical protein RLZZ387_3750 [Chloroflexota bacterium]|jgi:hypothetical protein
MWTPRVLIVTAVVIMLAALVLTSELDGISKATAMMSLVIAQVLVLRRR